MRAGPASARRVYAQAAATLANPASTAEQRATAEMQIRIAVRHCPDVADRCGRCGQAHVGQRVGGCPTRNARLRERAA